MQKVLIVTYYWPPGSGAGVQRWLKFSKYLPQYGWEPYILTVDQQYAAYPAIDRTLEKEIPENVKVFRTKATDWFRIYSKDKSKIPAAGFANNFDNSFKGMLFRFLRGNFFIPDPRKGWNRFALPKALEIIAKEGITCIITTSPPHSTQLIGLKIKKRIPGVKWVADFRDPWTDIYYYEQFYPVLISRKIDKWYEREVLKNCDKLITVSQSLKESLSLKVKGTKLKAEVITNGFDESDFKDITSASPSLFTITYVGTLSEAYPIDGLIDVLSEIQNRNKHFLLRFVGLVPENYHKKIIGKLNAGSVEIVPYIKHSEAISYMLNTSLLLLIIPDHKSSKAIITGKFFEYLASQKPILCLGPEDGDVAGIMADNGLGKCFSYYDKTKIKNFVLAEMAQPTVISKNIEKFSHKNLAKKLVSCLQ
jgi:glycosyltransferase involved in cell wall biosynthesis